MPLKLALTDVTSLPLTFKWSSKLALSWAILGGQRHKVLIKKTMNTQLIMLRYAYSCEENEGNHCTCVDSHGACFIFTNHIKVTEKFCQFYSVESNKIRKLTCDSGPWKRTPQSKRQRFYIYKHDRFGCSEN